MYERIKQLATKAGYTIGTVETLCGFGHGTIGKWKTSIPKADMLSRVASLLHTTSDYLLTGEGDTHPPKGNISEVIVPADGEMAEYLQQVKDKYGIMFDINKVASLDEVKATVAFITTLRNQGRDSE